MDNINRILKSAKELCRSVNEQINMQTQNLKGQYAKVNDIFQRRYQALKDSNRNMTERLYTYFENKRAYFKDKFDADALFAKIAEVSKTAGVNVVFMALVLYYALVGKEVPLRDKALVMAALGYFITPVDFIPDILGLIGFTDDMGILMLAFKQIQNNVSPEVIDHAKQKLTDWFGADAIQQIKF